LNILYAVSTLGGFGLFFGIALAIASILLKVEQDERIELVRNSLPGANCGGCGFANCNAMAEAIVTGNAALDSCPSINSDMADAISKIINMHVDAPRKMSAKVLCMGRDEVSAAKYRYNDISDCLLASKLAQGPKSCTYGCIGLGSCKNVCKFGAIKIIRGVAVIDPLKCTSCGQCVNICPKKIIRLVPHDNTVWVLCSSQDNASAVKDKCSAGCIGCKICEKLCPQNAIKITNCKAEINYDKCINCGKCASKCPKKIIKTNVSLHDEVQAELRQYKVIRG